MIRYKVVRTGLKWTIPFVAVPLLVYLSAMVFVNQKYLILSFGIAILALVLFWCSYEKKVVGARRAVLAAIMTALCVVGRMIPMIKPMTALVILTGIYLGSETGFFVGALAALLSNFYFGQGPWTPFQMLAWGLIGLLAGFLSTVLRRKRWCLLVYGTVMGVLYSAIMDIWTVLWWNGTFEISYYWAALGTAVPYTVLYAASNVLFLWLLGKPIGKKLERIALVYGI